MSWRKHILVGLAVLVFGVGVRLAMVHAAEPDLSAADLRKFEDTYGLDIPDWYETRPFFLLWTRGDGQAFIILASDLSATGPARELAVPVYRYSRVGYAWLGRLVVLGSLALVPVGLLAVNAAALVAVGILSSRLAQRRGAVAFLLVANPALYIGFASDTAEPLGIALLVAAIAAKGPAAGVWAAMLGAVRPSLATALPARGRGIPLLLIPFTLVGLAIRLIGVGALGSNPSIPGSTVVVPFTGYFEIWRELPTSGALVAGIPLLAALVTIYVGITRRSGWIRLSWVASGVLVLTFGSLVLESAINWTRAAAALPVLWGLPPRGSRGHP